MTAKDGDAAAKMDKVSKFFKGSLYHTKAECKIDKSSIENP
jgi:hypothetical protein